MTRPRVPGRVLLAVLLLLAAACGRKNSSSSASAGSAGDRLRAAASATLHASSFTLTLPTGVDDTYQAPDRVQQVEHGEGSSSSASNQGGPTSTSGTFATTITKVFIGDQYYEGDAIGGQAPVFNVAKRCANDENAVEYILRVLRAMSTATDVTVSGDTYTFRMATSVGTLPPVSTSQTAALAGGFVRTLSFTAAVPPAAMTIGSVDHTPPVTAPSSASPMTYSCDQ